jgi:hypothetical protein
LKLRDRRDRGRFVGVADSPKHQEQFFYSFRLDEAVSGDHPVREIAAVITLGSVGHRSIQY